MKVRINKGDCTITLLDNSIRIQKITTNNFTIIKTTNDEIRRVTGYEFWELLCLPDDMFSRFIEKLSSSNANIIVSQYLDYQIVIDKRNEIVRITDLKRHKSVIIRFDDLIAIKPSILVARDKVEYIMSLLASEKFIQELFKKFSKDDI